MAAFQELVAQGRYEDAAARYFDELAFAPIGLDEDPPGGAEVALLESLFPDGVDQPPALAEPNAGFILVKLGHAYEEAGRLTEAHAVTLRALESNVDQPGGLPVDPRRLSQVVVYETALGKLRDATLRARSAVTSPEDGSYRVKLGRLAVVTATIGDTDGALALLDALDPRLDSTRILKEIDVRVLRGEYKEALRLDEARTGDVYGPKQTYLAALEARTHVGDGEKVVSLASELLAFGREQPWASRVRLLLIRAGAHLSLGHLELAAADLDEFSEAASPGPYRLMLADAAVLRAVVARADGQRDAELAAAREAYELAWCDGAPFTYHRTLGQARETLRQAGVEPPHLHPVLPA